MKEPLHIFIEGFGGFCCKSNQEVLLERTDALEIIIKRTNNKLKFLEREIDNPTSDVPFDKYFKYDSILDPREYYPKIFKEGEENEK